MVFFSRFPLLKEWQGAVVEGVEEGVGATRSVD